MLSVESHVMSEWCLRSVLPPIKQQQRSDVKPNSYYTSAFNLRNALVDHIPINGSSQTSEPSCKIFKKEVEEVKMFFFFFKKINKN